MATDFGFLILGLAILVAAGDALVRGAVALSLRIGMPAVIVSATVVAFGTSAPELLISVQAVLEGASDIALGNVVGSNIANVFLVVGVPAIVAPIAGCGKAAHRNLYFMLGATAVFTALVLTGDLGWVAGLVLLAVVLVMIGDSIRAGMIAAPAAGQRAELELEELEDVDPRMARWKMAALVAAGLVGLPLGAHLLVDGAQGIARTFGVSEAVIGLTIVAIGTSLPELATTVMAAIRKQADVVIGSVVGSNIFNVTAIIGIAAFFGTIEIPAEILARDIWVMLAATLALTPFVLYRAAIRRLTGSLFLVAYIAYVAYTYAPPG
jgi:cation:H+ antiporter